MNFFAAKACVIAGAIIVVFELVLRDITGIIIGLIVLIGGSVFYWVQGLAWKQWEDRKIRTHKNKE